METDEDNDSFDIEKEERAAEDAGMSFKPTAVSSERRSSRQLWLISYSDFMTILMIFFLAMYGYTYLAKASLLKAQKNRLNYEEFSGQIEKMEKTLGDQIKVQDHVDKVVVQLNDAILFPSGSASLSAAAAPALEELANSIKLIDGEVIVQGHTDDVPIRGGRFKSNWELSSARAFSVISALTEQGVPPERLAAWGFGENRPIAGNLTAEGRGQNRRIEVVILKKKPRTEEKNGG